MKTDTIIDNEWLKTHDSCAGGVRCLEKNTGIGAKAGIILRDTLDKSECIYFRWLATRLMDKSKCVEWAIFCAEQVLYIFEEKYPNDFRPRESIQATKKYLSDPSEENRIKLRIAAYAAADAYDAAVYAADAAARKSTIKKCADKVLKILGRN